MGGGSQYSLKADFPHLGWPYMWRAIIREEKRVLSGEGVKNARKKGKCGETGQESSF